jgi:hypothetical protein
VIARDASGPLTRDQRDRRHPGRGPTCGSRREPTGNRLSLPRAMASEARPSVGTSHGERRHDCARKRRSATSRPRSTRKWKVCSARASRPLPWTSGVSTNWSPGKSGLWQRAHVNANLSVPPASVCPVRVDERSGQPGTANAHLVCPVAPSVIAQLCSTVNESCREHAGGRWDCSSDRQARFCACTTRGAARTSMRPER